MKIFIETRQDFFRYEKLTHGFLDIATAARLADVSTEYLNREHGRKFTGFFIWGKKAIASGEFEIYCNEPLVRVIAGWRRRCEHKVYRLDYRRCMDGELTASGVFVDTPF